MKKIVSLILVVFMLVPILVSCDDLFGDLLRLTLDSKVYDFEYTANIMDWTSEANNLFVNEQLDAYKSMMDSLAKRAVKGTGGGTLEKFLSVYGEMSFRG